MSCFCPVFFSARLLCPAYNHIRYSPRFAEVWTIVNKRVPCNDKVINCWYDETDQAKVPIEDLDTWFKAWSRCCHTKVDQGKCKKEDICSSRHRPSPSQRPVYDHRFVLELYHYLSKSDTTGKSLFLLIVINPSIFSRVRFGKRSASPPPAPCYLMQ